MREGRTANTAALATYLPLELERSDLREPWLRRLLSNKFWITYEVMKSFARPALPNVARYKQVIQYPLKKFIAVAAIKPINIVESAIYSDDIIANSTLFFG